MPFNQRLVSSTPASTPRRKRIVERQGVLLLNGSTETQILNSTDTAAAVRPSSPPRPPGPYLCRGDVQFAAAPHPSSSSLSVSSSADSCGVDAAIGSSAGAYPLYTVASGRAMPHSSVGIPCRGTIPSTMWQPPITSQPGPFSPVPSTDHNRPPAIPVTSHVCPEHGGISDLVYMSAGFSPPRTAADHLRQPVILSQAPIPPCSCTEPVLTTDVTNTAVTSDRRRPPVTVTASSSQETIEIHLERSPGRSEAQEQFTMVRGTAADRNLRRRLPRSRTGRERSTSSNRRTRPRRPSVAENNDRERLVSLLSQLKVVITANRDPQLARLLSEVCEAARTSPVLPPSQMPVQSTVNDPSPVVEQLQCEITQLNRLGNVIFIAIVTHDVSLMLTDTIELNISYCINNVLLN